METTQNLRRIWILQWKIISRKLNEYFGHIRWQFQLLINWECSDKKTTPFRMLILSWEISGLLEQYSTHLMNITAWSDMAKYDIRCCETDISCEIFGTKNKINFSWQYMYNINTIKYMDGTQEVYTHMCPVVWRTVPGRHFCTSRVLSSNWSSGLEN